MCLLYIYKPHTLDPSPLSHPCLNHTHMYTPTHSRLFVNVKGDVRAVESPEEEVAHWLQAVRLYQQEYSKPFQVRCCC